ncbi:MAG: BspA family leucine-rich repeat surface protein, partial [Brevefilum sp.]
NAFNQDISGWNTSSVTDMSDMFHNASAFDQNLGDWTVTALTAANGMFDGVALSTVNYDPLLIGWNAQALQTGVTFSGGNSIYCLGESARDNMEDIYGWEITDGGMNCSPFIITVKTDADGESDNTQFTIPTHPAEDYNYNVNCGADDADNGFSVTGDFTCSYGSAGTYTIRIIGNNEDGSGFPRIYFNNGGDKNKLQTIEQWGTGLWSSMGSAFYGCQNLGGQASDNPNLTDVTDMSDMFHNASAFNQNIGGWNTSTVTNMSNMFHNASAFDQNLGGWTVTALEKADGMFDGITLSTTNYDDLLIGWNEQELQKEVMFSGGNSTYCSGESARENMINTYEWTITDGGMDCGLFEYIFPLFRH